MPEILRSNQEQFGFYAPNSRENLAKAIAEIRLLPKDDFRCAYKPDELIDFKNERLPGKSAVLQTDLWSRLLRTKEDDLLAVLDDECCRSGAPSPYEIRFSDVDSADNKVVFGICGGKIMRQVWLGGEGEEILVGALRRPTLLVRDYFYNEYGKPFVVWERSRQSSLVMMYGSGLEKTQKRGGDSVGYSYDQNGLKPVFVQHTERKNLKGLGSVNMNTVSWINGSNARTINCECVDGPWKSFQAEFVQVPGKRLYQLKMRGESRNGKTVQWQNLMTHDRDASIEGIVDIVSSDTTFTGFVRKADVTMQ